MIRERWERLSRLVVEALELAPERRDAFLHDACEGDATLRSEIESLVAAAESGSSFIDRPLWAVPAGVIPDVEPVRVTEEDSWLGRVLLGKYKLAAVVGRGGMGTVYRATDVTGGRRQVAIKLVEEPIVGRLLASRLRAERQIMSRFDHPNIARLLDWGTTADGFPFLVMEFVAGDRIDAYCRKHDLAVRDRVALFRQLCSAVKYAHRNLVVHRDIKPGNVLVTDSGVVKLLDFGIAKLLRSDGDEVTLDQTRAGEWLFTPGYASPEQLRGEPVTTASDVYALGVLLYELLTNVRFSAAPEGSNVRPLVAASEVSDSSGRQATTHGARTRRGRRAKAAETIDKDLTSSVRRRARSHSLRGDLQQIVKTATRLDADRRYATVDQLSDDARRYLEGLPLLSRGESLFYTTRKFIARHYGAAALALIAILGLAAGVGLYAWKAEAARAAERRTSRLLYASRMRLAFKAWSEANTRATRELLEQARMTSDGVDLRGIEWTYLWNQLNRPGRSNSLAVPQDAWVSDLCFSPDGRVAATGDSAGTLTLWDSSTAAHISQASRGDRDIAALCYSPDGRFIAAASERGSVSIWKADASEVVAEHPAPLGGWPRYGSLAFAPDGTRIALCGGGDGKVSVRDIATGKEITSFFVTAGESKGQVVTATALSSDVRFVAAAIAPDASETGGLRTSISVWNLQSGQLVRTWSAGGGGVHALGFSPNGRLLAGASIGTIRVWELETGEIVDLYSGHTQLADVLHFSTDGQLLVTGSLNVTHLRNVMRRSNVAVFKMESAQARLSPNGDTIGLVNLDGQIEFFDVSERGVHEQIPGSLIGRPRSETVHTADFTSNIVSGWVFKEAWIAVNSFVPSAPLVLPPRLREQPDQPAFESEYLPVVATQNGTRFEFLDADTGACLDTWTAAVGTVRGIAMSSQPGVFAVVEDGRLAVSVGGNARFIELPDSSEVSGLPRFSPDGETLGAIMKKSGTLLLWSIRDLAQIGAVSSDTPITQFAVSPDSMVVAVGYLDGSIETRRISDNAVVSRHSGHKEWVFGLTFTGDGRRLISSGAIDNTLRIWEPDTGEEVGIVALDEPAYTHGRFDLRADGTLLISDGPATTTHVWRAPRSG